MHSEFFMIQKMKNGNEEACEWFVNKYYAPVYQYCFLHIHDTYCAEDMTQETFLHFFASLKTYTFYGKTKNYLYSIAGNIVKNYYKKKKELLIDEIPENGGKSISHMEGRVNAADIELRMDIERAVDVLPEELKETAILFFFQELKQKEIADLLNIKLSLVKYRVGRAKKLLAEYLEVGSE